MRRVALGLALMLAVGCAPRPTPVWERYNIPVSEEYKRFVAGTGPICGRWQGGEYVCSAPRPEPQPSYGGSGGIAPTLGELMILGELHRINRNVILFGH